MGNKHFFNLGLICIFSKKKEKKKSLPTYPPLPRIGRPTANKDIFKSGLRPKKKYVCLRSPDLP
jgi:hypothetical protein